MAMRNRDSITIKNRRTTISADISARPTPKFSGKRIIKIFFGSTLILYGSIAASSLFLTGKTIGGVFSLMIPLLGLFIIVHKPKPPEKSRKNWRYTTV